MQVDSLKTSTDTFAVTPTVIEVYDSVNQDIEIEQTPIPKLVPQIIDAKLSQVKSIKIVPSEKDSAIINFKPSNTFVPDEYPVFLPYTSLNAQDSSNFKQNTQVIKSFQSETSTLFRSAQIRNKVRVFEKEWVLGVSLLIVVLLIIVRAVFQKQLSSIIASVINIRTADKLLREKNAVLRRVFFILNFTYLLILGLYFYQLTKRLNLQFSIENDFFLFLFILLILILATILRLIFVKSIAFVFDANAVFNEYLHNSFIISKNIGLYLFPVIISIVFVNEKIAGYLFILASIMLALSLVFRYLKGIQIILKHNIFLFYSILYLCTLEILPVLIGIKFVLER